MLANSMVYYVSSCITSVVVLVLGTTCKVFE